MTEGRGRNWMELCRAAIEAKHSEELIEIVEALNKALEREDQVLRDCRVRSDGPAGRARIQIGSSGLSPRKEDTL
jgi:hypothetical protein